MEPDIESSQTSSCVDIGLAAADPAWISLLDSEGVSWRMVDSQTDPSKLPEVSILPACATAKTAKLLEDSVFKGKSVIADRGPRGNEGALTWIEHRFPFHPESFAATETLEAGVSLRVGSSNGRIGRCYLLPMRLADFWAARRVGRNYVVFDPDEPSLVWHKHNTIVKRNVRRLVSQTIQMGFHDRGLPYVHKWYWPGRNRSVFSLRGDMDGGPEGNLNCFLDAVQSNRDCVTLFVCGRPYRERLPLLRSIVDAGVELGNHTFCHYVFPDRHANRRNVTATERMLNELDYRPKGFATPAYFWHPSLYHSLVERGYQYATCFGLDHDHLPYQPVVQGKISPVLEIPFHCVGDFLGKFSIDLAGPQTRQFFTRLIEKKLQAAEPIMLYGHPDMENRLGSHPGLVRHIFGEVLQHSDVWGCQLSQLQHWWSRRDQWQCRFRFDQHSSELTCHVDHSPGDEYEFTVCVRMPDGSSHLVRPAATGITKHILGNESSTRPLVLPDPTDVGEVVHRDEPATLRDRFWGLRRETRRLLKNYADIYRV